MLSARCVLSVIKTISHLYYDQRLLPIRLHSKDLMIRNDFKSGCINHWQLEIPFTKSLSEDFPFLCTEGAKKLKVAWIIVNAVLVFLHFNVEREAWDAVMERRNREDRIKPNKMVSYEFMQIVLQQNNMEETNELLKITDKGPDFMASN